VAILLLLCLFWFQSLLALVPFTVLAAMLIAVGCKLVLKLRHAAEIHWQQAGIFMITAASAVYWDLAIGVLCGIIAKLSLCIYYVIRGMLRHTTEKMSGWERGRIFYGHVKALFRSPVTRMERVVDTCHVYFAGPLACFNLPYVLAMLAQVPADVKRVHLHVDPLWCYMIDPTSLEHLCQWGKDMEAKGVDVEYPGLQEMIRISCMLMSPGFAGVSVASIAVTNALVSDDLREWELLEQATHGPPGSQRNGDDHC
jgi:MFS superfamily sulfate permease-like transporter